MIVVSEYKPFKKLWYFLSNCMKSLETLVIKTVLQTCERHKFKVIACFELKSNYWIIVDFAIGIWNSIYRNVSKSVSHSEYSTKKSQELYGHVYIEVTNFSKQTLTGTTHRDIYGKVKVRERQKIIHRNFTSTISKDIDALKWIGSNM